MRTMFMPTKCAIYCLSNLSRFYRSEYDLTQNENTSLLSTQDCYQDFYMDVLALGYFTKFRCWAMTGDVGEVCVVLGVCICMDLETLAGVLSAHFHFPLEMNCWCVNQEWLKGKAGTIIFLICFEVGFILLLIILKCHMDKSILFGKKLKI